MWLFCAFYDIQTCEKWKVCERLPSLRKNFGENIFFPCCLIPETVKSIKKSARYLIWVCGVKIFAETERKKIDKTLARLQIPWPRSFFAKRNTNFALLPKGGKLSTNFQNAWLYPRSNLELYKIVGGKSGTGVIGERVFAVLSLLFVY